MNRFDYKEPEFKVIVTAKEDILTVSGASASLGTITDDWDTGSSGGGIGGISFGV